jgi:DNA (cytosine-5)-methyltransferase 1
MHLLLSVPMSALTAVEFFSGIGAFGQSAKRHGVDVIAAFDQSQVANYVYEVNHGLAPQARNLDTLKAGDLPPSDIWWLSPPCQPYTVRGKRLDDQDTRARSLNNLIEILPANRPQIIMVENVISFGGSRMHARLHNQLEANDFDLQELELCPTMFGIPMRRQRKFLIGVHRYSRFAYQRNSIPETSHSTIVSYLDKSHAPVLEIPVKTLEKYNQGLNIIDASDPQSTAICFTSGYGRCMRVSGSLLRMNDGTVRRFSPVEMLRLFGFSDSFIIPADISIDAAWKLVGNSVDVRAIDYLLSGLN